MRTKAESLYTVPNAMLILKGIDNFIDFWHIIEYYSGPTAPSTGKIWYDTTTNLIKRNVSGTWTSEQQSLPIGIVNVSDTDGITSINQVFNGFGFIGSTVFALPGVKGLVPNGRNVDGSLKNIEIKTTNVLTQTFGTGALTRYVYLGQDRIVGNISNYTYIQDTTPTAQAGNVYWINNETNYIKYTNTQGSNWNVVPYILCGNGLITDSTGKITAFRSPSNTFQSLDYNDKSEIAGWGMPGDKYIDLILGASGTSYIAPANGYIYFVCQGPTSYFYMTNQTIANIGSEYGTCANLAGGYYRASLQILKGHQIGVFYDGSITFIKGFFIYAEGEN